MKPSKNYIFFDEIVTDYFNQYGEKYEYILTKDLKKYLACLSKKSEIVIITSQDTHKVTNWLIKNDLYQFTHTVTNTAI
jgi:hypothetical protein